MDQNINLLTTLNIQPQSFFNAKLIFQATFGWILLLIFIYIISLLSYSNKQKTLVNLETTKKNLQAQIETLTQELSKIGGAKIIQQDFKGLPLSSSNIIGFYRYLEDLAEFTPPGVWLNNIVFSQPDGLIKLKGKALNATKVPAFIDALNNSSDFNEKKFGTLQMQKIPDSNYIDFTLGTITTTQQNEILKKTNEPITK